jgi:hypothetical protein
LRPTAPVGIAVKTCVILPMDGTSLRTLWMRVTLLPLPDRSKKGPAA